MIEAGNASSLWTVSDPIYDLIVPDDRRAVLRIRRASASFDAAAPSLRHNLPRYLAQAKRPGARANRIDRITDHAAQSEKSGQYRPVSGNHLSHDGLSDDVRKLWFIGLDPWHDRRSGGRTPLSAAEQVARSGAGRMLPIETSSDAAFDRARELYAAAWYAEEARIRNCQAPGNAKIIFRRGL